MMADAARAALNTVPFLAFETFLFYASLRGPLVSSVGAQVILALGLIAFTLVSGIVPVLLLLVVPAAIVGALFAIESRRDPDRPPPRPDRSLPPDVARNVPLLERWRAARAGEFRRSSGRAFRTSLAVPFRSHAEQLFPFIGDFPHFDAWPGRNSSSVRLDDGPWGVGARYRQDISVRGRVHPSVWEVTEFAPPSTFGCASVADYPGVVVASRIDLEPRADEGVLLTVETTAEVFGSMATFLTWLRWPLQSAIFRWQQRRQLTRFRAWVESHLERPAV